MGSDFENMLEECRRRISQGVKREDLILYLHNEGLTIIESMKILKKIYNLSLGEAKEQVTAHPAWASEVRSADVLHEELQHALEKELNSRPK
jgi:ribosomal protein L7/L12